MDSEAQELIEEVKLIPTGLFQYIPHKIPWRDIPNTNLCWDNDDGLRIYRKDPEDKTPYIVTIEDWINEIPLFHGEWEDPWLVTNNKMFIPIGFQIKSKKGEILYQWRMEPSKCRFLVTMPEGTIGDSIAWCSHCPDFQEKWNCELWVQTNQFIIDIYAKNYPNIKWVTRREVWDKEPKVKFDGIYRAGLFHKPNIEREPISHKICGLGKGLAHILGVPPIDKPLKPTIGKRTIKEKYVCIAPMASSYTKMWNNPSGWIEVIDYLKHKGYRVLCIDKSKISVGPKGYFQRMPPGCEDFTGDIPLQERVNLLAYCDMFIGCSSGLSWLAWTVGCPYILISGFTDPQTEPYNPYRVISYYGCHGCWNDMNLTFDNKDYTWCPNNKDFECSRIISGKMVINMIDKVIKDKEKLNGKS